MGAYKYHGVNTEGVKLIGEVEARHERHARRLLRSQGIKVIKIEEPSLMEMDINSWLVEKGIFPPFNTVELNRFTKQLAILINAGVPIMESMEILAKQEKNISLKNSITGITDSVGAGKTLFEAMSEQKGFNRLYCALVKAGEAAGILDTILNKLSEFMERQEAIRKKIKSAMTYPSIVIVAGVTVVTVLMVYVVPQFVGMLQESNQEIPAVTQFVIDLSNFFGNYILHMIAGTVFSLTMFSKWKATRSGKLSWDRITMQSPVFGQIIIKGSLAGFARTLATMLSAGVSIIDALDICVETLDNVQIARDIRMVRESVVKGKSITEPLGRIKYFPPLVNQMMKVGESTGNLDQMLLKVADVFESETNEAIDNMTKLIEPLILLVLGGVICLVLVAMYLPIFMSAGGAES